MSKFILVLSFLLGSKLCMANLPAIDHKIKGTIDNAVYIACASDFLGPKGMDFLRAIAEKSSLYQFLLSLDSNVPGMTRQLEFVALLNEAHLTNQKLSELTVELKKMNHMLEHQYRRTKAMDG